MMILTMTLVMTSTITLLTSRVSVLTLAYRPHNTFIVIKVTNITVISQLFRSCGTRLRSSRVLARRTRVPMSGIKVRLFSIRVLLLLPAAEALRLIYWMLVPAIRALVRITRLQKVRSWVMLSRARVLMPVA